MDNLTAERVADYLRKHTDFFLAFGDVLADMHIPHESGAAVSLVERQVSILRERNIDLRHRLNRLLEAARDNDMLFEKMRALVLAIMEAGDASTLIAALFHGLLREFRIDAASLMVFDAQGAFEDERARYVSTADAQEKIPGIMKQRRPVCGALKPEELEYLFAELAPRVGSAAVVPVHFRHLNGLLAIGSFDAQHFRSSMDTLFLTHIADVLARRLALYVPAPQQQASA